MIKYIFIATNIYISFIIVVFIVILLFESFVKEIINPS